MDNFIIKLPYWGDIKISKEEKAIIEHPAFKRLQNIHQLGFAYFHNPLADIKRYEHSIAVGYLAGVVSTVLAKKHPELKINSRHILLTKIAGLCHDIGHGPFSHCFDQFLNHITDKHVIKRHEERSCILIAWIMNQYPDLFTEDDSYIVQCIIDPKFKKPPKNLPHCLTEIVSNSRHGLDVDRLEYISREKIFLSPQTSYIWDAYSLLESSYVSNSHWEFTNEKMGTVKNILSIRERLYKEFYKHHKKREMANKFTLVLSSSDSVLQISKVCYLKDDRDILSYIALDDSILKIIQNTKDPRLKKAKELAMQISSII